MLWWRKGTLILPPLFLHMTLLPIISYQYFFNLSHCCARTSVLMPKSSLMPSQKYTSKASNFSSAGSRQYRLLSTCWSTGFLAEACLQSLLKCQWAKENVFNAVLLQYQPFACGWHNYYDHSYFSVMAEMKHRGVIRAQRPTNSSRESFTCVSPSILGL